MHSFKNKSKRPVDALAVKKVSDWLTHSLKSRDASASKKTLAFLKVFHSVYRTWGKDGAIRGENISSVWFQNGKRLIRFVNCCGVVLNNDCIFVSWCRDSWMFGMMITMNNMKITFESSTSQNILASIWRHFYIFSKFLPFRLKINSQSICVHLHQHF